MKQHFIPVTFAVALAALIMPSSAHAINSSYNLLTSTLNGPSSYDIMFDYTQADNLNAIVSNTQLTSTLNTFPLTGFNQPPVAAIDPSLWPSSSSSIGSINSNSLYWLVDTGNTNVTSPSTTANEWTCYQNLPGWCPSGSKDVPQDFIHMTATYSAGSITPIQNSALAPTNAETPANFFSLTNNQAFDMDRMRYAANRLWLQWYLDVEAQPRGRSQRNGNWETMSLLYNPSPNNKPYQLTGTMSFENFLDNIDNQRPMYGIVRVVVPVVTKTSGGHYGEIEIDANQPLQGNEFFSDYVWGTGNSAKIFYSNATTTNLGSKNGPKLSNLIGSWNSIMYGNSSAKSAKIIVYGSLMFDYVDASTYTPDDFADDNQDYINNFASVTAHDNNQCDNGVENCILPRSTVQSENLEMDEKMEINPAPEGTDNEVDSVAAANSYIQKQNVAFAANGRDYSDAAVWEYWMRQAVTNPPTPTGTYNSIVTDLTNPNNYDYVTQTFVNTGDTYLGKFINSVWPKMQPKDQFHTYFPCGYEHGWMVAFNMLRMDLLDQTTSTPTVAGSWWSELTQATPLPNATASGVTQVTLGPTSGGTQTTTPIGIPVGATGGSPDGAAAYPKFGIPSVSQDITLDAGSGTATLMPNFFSTGWEDMPAFYYAGGYLNLQGSTNISGMVYTPDSAYLAPAAGATGASAGFMLYINGALLAGDGMYMAAPNSANYLLAVSFNYNAFNRLLHGPMLTTQTLANITEIRGQ